MRHYLQISLKPCKGTGVDSDRLILCMQPFGIGKIPGFQVFKHSKKFQFFWRNTELWRDGLNIYKLRLLRALALDFEKRKWTSRRRRRRKIYIVAQCATFRLKKPARTRAAMGNITAMSTSSMLLKDNLATERYRSNIPNSLHASSATYVAVLFGESPWDNILGPKKIIHGFSCARQ